MAQKKWFVPAEVFYDEAGVTLRRGAAWWLQLPMLGLLLACAILLTAIAGDFFGWLWHRLVILILFAGIGCWRWGWFFLKNLRQHALRSVAVVDRFTGCQFVERCAERIEIGAVVE